MWSTGVVYLNEDLRPLLSWEYVDRICTFLLSKVGIEYSNTVKTLTWIDTKRLHSHQDMFWSKATGGNGNTNTRNILNSCTKREWEVYLERNEPPRPIQNIKSTHYDEVWQAYQEYRNNIPQAVVLHIVMSIRHCLRYVIDANRGHIV
jgi:hypothetical protein